MEEEKATRRGYGLDEAVELISKRLTTSFVLAAGIIGLAIYARPAPPRYQIVAQGTQVVRLDTRNGSIIACEGSRCYRVLKSHGRIQVEAKTKTLPAAPAKAPEATPPAAPQPPAPR